MEYVAMENIQNKIQEKKLEKKSAELTCGTILNCSNTFVIKDPEELIGEHKW